MAKNATGQTKPATKAQRVARAVADAVGAGRAVQLETVDFNDPNRPKTCLEVDFPILPVNQVAAIERQRGQADLPDVEVVGAPALDRVPFAAALRGDEGA